MAGRKNNRKKGGKDDLIRKVISIFSDNPTKSFNYKQISSFIEAGDKRERTLVFEVLNQLTDQEVLKEVQRGKYKYSGKALGIEGIYEAGRKGKAYVSGTDLGYDVFIPAHKSGKALNGDRVTIKLSGKGQRKGKQEGEIVAVLNQRERLFVGTVEKDGKNTFFVPDDVRIDVDFFISKGKDGGAEDGYKAVARIVDWPDSAKSPFAEITDVLGRPESNDAEMKAILMANGIRFEFPEEVLAESGRIDIRLPQSEIEKRRDFRDILTMTIDPVDAKDFDDAISLELLENDRFRIGVHIADVGHYVNEGTALDKEALERGNSVYLVDRVVPMLPEHLSNGVCSLRPNEEKFTFSAVFEMDQDGKVYDQWFGKTVIKSDRRFTYEEAQERIIGGDGDYAREICILDNIAKVLRKKRIKNGALEVQSSELRFELDPKGMPVNVFKKTTVDSNKLVEEFMLLANRKVGEFVGKVTNGKPPGFVYRVHDKPDLDRVEQFAVFVSKFGEKFKFKDERDISREMNRIFKIFEGEAEAAMIQQMAIKSMAKAEYDTENIGHYGLGFDYYVHFTSPIRRYADLIVHRILLEKIEKSQRHHKGLRDVAKHISITERRAVEAERSSKKFFQAKFLEDKEGEVFRGTITGLTEWGIYVEMDENFCEGMIPLKAIRDDRYVFDEKHYVTVGQRTGNEFNIGDVLYVKIARVNLPKKQIDLELMD